MILLKNKDQIQNIDYACKIVRDTLFYVEEQIVPGITTDLDRMAEEFIFQKELFQDLRVYMVFQVLYVFQSKMKLFMVYLLTVN